MQEQQRSTCDTCGLISALDVIGGKWKALILWEIHTQARRFGEFKRLVPGISEKMLIQALRKWNGMESFTGRQGLRIMN